MPKKMMLNLNNGNYSKQQLAQFQEKYKASIPKTNSGMTLNSSIIGRIHNVRPGCGSCGK
jgi:hypothetical protein